MNTLNIEYAKQLIREGKEQIAKWEMDTELGINLFLEKRIQQFRMEIEMLENYIKEGK